MAISILEYGFLSFLAKKNLFPKNPQVLEFGEQHWHGDVPLELLKSDICNLIASESKQRELIDDLESIVKKTENQKIFEISKIAYQAFLQYSSIQAIDLHGTENAWEFDLNKPVEIDQRFDVTINLGTAEHVFNVYQFFKTVHDLTQPGGVMLHCMPFLGCIDHGFWSFQPTFFWDLAESNGYKVVAFLIAVAPLEFVEILDRNGVINYLQGIFDAKNYPYFIQDRYLYVALQKADVHEEFRIPMQKFFQISKEEYWNMSKVSNSSLTEELKLKEINLIVFPNWNLSEELIISELEELIRAVGIHPDRQQITLLIDTSNFPVNSETNAEEIVSAIVLNLCLNEGLDIANEGIEISFLENLNQEDWQILLPEISYQVSLSGENIQAIENLAKEIKSCDIKNFLGTRFPE